MTGASGFIGRQCLRALRATSFEIHAVSRKGPGTVYPKVVWHKHDLRETAAVSMVFRECRPTHLIHSAWDVESCGYWNSAENLDWAARSADLLCAAARNGVVRAVGIGTCAEYGLDNSVCDEFVTPMNPVGAYAQAKHATQVLFAAAGSALGISTAWARLFFPYGPGERPTKLIPYTIAQLAKGEAAEFSSGKQVRDFLFEADVGAALVALLSSEVTGPVNVGTGLGVPVAEVVQRIGELMGRPELICLGRHRARDMEPARWVAAVYRLTREVGWTSITSLENGLRQTIAALADPISRQGLELKEHLSEQGRADD